MAFVSRVATLLCAQSHATLEFSRFTNNALYYGTYIAFCDRTIDTHRRRIIAPLTAALAKLLLNHLIEFKF